MALRKRTNSTMSRAGVIAGHVRRGARPGARCSTEGRGVICVQRCTAALTDAVGGLELGWRWRWRALGRCRLGVAGGGAGNFETSNDHTKQHTAESDDPGPAEATSMTYFLLVNCHIARERLWRRRCQRCIALQKNRIAVRVCMQSGNCISAQRAEENFFSYAER
jgi:hypothetical protein